MGYTREHSGHLLSYLGNLGNFFRHLGAYLEHLRGYIKYLIRQEAARRPFGISKRILGVLKGPLEVSGRPLKALRR